MIKVRNEARIDDPDTLRAKLKEKNPIFKGLDHQIDTYFKVPKGRLKIREGTVESCLVYYERPDDSGPKRCDYVIEQFEPGDPAIDGIKSVLTASNGIIAVVDKRREIYYIDNVKFHIDNVESLGSFFEIEAIGADNMSENDLRKQCGYYLEMLGIGEDQLLDVSYSDMIINNGQLTMINEKRKERQEARVKTGMRKTGIHSHGGGKDIPVCHFK